MRKTIVTQAEIQKNKQKLILISQLFKSKLEIINILLIKIKTD